MSAPDRASWKCVGETTNTVFYEIEPRILAAEARTGASDTGETARENIDFYFAYFRDNSPGVLLYVLGKVVDQSREARHVYRDSSNPELVCGVGLVFQSLIAHAMAALFVGMRRSSNVPIKAFNSVDDAVHWARKRLAEVG